MCWDGHLQKSLGKRGGNQRKGEKRESEYSQKREGAVWKVRYRTRPRKKRVHIISVSAILPLVIFGFDLLSTLSLVVTMSMVSSSLGEMTHPSGPEPAFR